MSSSLRARLRALRYALPSRLGRVLPSPTAAAAARLCDRLHARGLAATVGYFQFDDVGADDIEAANLAIAALLARRQGDAWLAIKAPPLRFDADRIAAIAAAAASARMTLMFDAHAPKDADRTLEAVEALLPRRAATGLALPARWQRSLADAERFRETGAVIRLVKGEWPDPLHDPDDIAARYLDLVSTLAGRRAKVTVATHDPDLAARALDRLAAAGTPCELEQLRGLPRRRTTAVARRRGVPVRVYLPFGPGWWPYALDKALARPYLLEWMIRDRLGR